MAIGSPTKTRSRRFILWTVILVTALVLAACVDNSQEQEQLPPTEANKSQAGIEPRAVERPIRHRFAVQVGAFAERANAESLAQRLSSSYEQTVLVAPTETPRGTLLYLVRIPVQTESEAERLVVRIGSEYELKPTVVSLP